MMRASHARTAYVLVGLGLGACTGTGVVVSVESPDVAVDEVRLFVGVGSSATAAIRPPAIARTPIDADYWSRDAHDSDAMYPAATSFTFVDDGTTSELPAMIAVGFAGGQAIAAGALLATAFPASDYDEFSIPLKKRSATFDFQVWSADPQAAAEAATCAGVDGAGFIVTPGDRDCDGFGDADPRECDPNVYRANRPPVRSELSCLAPGLSSCTFGGPACVDGVMPDASACTPAAYCSTPRMCEVCSGIACASDITPLVPDNLPLYVECKLHADVDGGVCPGDLPLPASTTALACSNVGIRGPNDNAFRGKLVDGDLELELANMGCAITLAPSGKIDAARGTIGALVVVDVASHPGFALPIEIHVTADGCGTPNSCHFAGAEPLSVLTACLGT